MYITGIIIFQAAARNDGIPNAKVSKGEFR